jgi:predicted phage tail protein
VCSSDLFSKSFRAVSDRQDFIAVMLYREANPSEIGIQRTKQVAYTATPLDAPVEQFDMTDFCTSADHAAIYAKYELAKRKFSTHSISFETALITTGLKPTDIIKIERQRISSHGDNRAEIEWYQITAVTYGSDGGSTIEAEHFPVSSSDIAEISNSIINGSFRVL